MGHGFSQINTDFRPKSTKNLCQSVLICVLFLFLRQPASCRRMQPAFGNAVDVNCRLVFKLNNVVRVVALDITESVSSQIPGLRMAGIGVHVRTINDDGQILACYLPVARIQLYNGRNEGDPTWREYDEAWDKAEALKERVIAYLEQVAAEKGFAVRAAGETRPLRATWQSDPTLAKAFDARQENA